VRNCKTLHTRKRGNPKKGSCSGTFTETEKPLQASDYKNLAKQQGVAM
jgi:hypothetical protein